MSEKTAIEKMVEYLDSSASIGASRSENIRIAKRLASLEAKPTANADLVGELTQVLEDWADKCGLKDGPEIEDLDVSYGEFKKILRQFKTKKRPDTGKGGR